MTASSPATIRQRRTEDIEPIMDVWRRANALAHPFLTDAYVAQSEREIRDLYLPVAETYVLEDAGKVVGLVALAGNEVAGLFLDPSCHGRGYGKAMLDHAQALKGPLKVEVFLANEQARAFYERYGFTTLADDRHPATGQLVRRMAMTGA